MTFVRSSWWTSFLLPANEVAKVIFSVVSVRHSVHDGSHVTIIHDALDLSVKGPPPFWTWHLRIPLRSWDLRDPTFPCHLSGHGT